MSPFPQSVVNTALFPLCFLFRLLWSFVLRVPKNLKRPQIEHANCYGLSADTSSETGQQISNEQATICRHETVQKDSIQISGSTSNDDLRETGLQTKATTTSWIMDYITFT